MAKKKGNNKNQKQVREVKATPVIIKGLSNEDKLNIEQFAMESQEQIKEQNLDLVINLSSESTTKLEESKAKDDLSKYWTFVQEINKRLESLINKTREEKEKTVKLNLDMESSQKDLEKERLHYKEKVEDYNRKDKELIEREFALDNGEYIRKLFDTIKETQKKVVEDTKTHIIELSSFHKDNLEEFSKKTKEYSQYASKLNALEREKKKFNVDKQIYEEDLREEYDNKYSEELKHKTNELERLTRKLEKIEAENNDMNQLIVNLRSTFGAIQPNEILAQNSILQKELLNLKNQLNERPEKLEFESKRDQIDLLSKKVEELQSKINEGELLELKQRLYNQDSYIIEINAYKNEIESTKVREATMNKTINDLSKTIELLKGETTNKSEAFEFANLCDVNTDDLGFNSLSKTVSVPNNLNELVTYVQQRMANKSNNPFYYSRETIQIFLAGLHMSQISILQGISGTGKTSLPREFATALISDYNYAGKDDNNQIKAPYRICSIQSGWRDNMDLMGYFNSFEHKYKETEFFKALYLANQPKYSDTLFFIILDEMNLSRPEHYFADFLSLLEQESDKQYIDLTNTPHEYLPKLIKGGKLRIPPNLRFIGTANHDETTLEFAPKTYDRSNVMEIPSSDHSSIKNEIHKQHLSLNINYSWLANEFKEAEAKHVKSFDKFHNFITSEVFKTLLEEKGIAISNRLEDQAKRFIGVYLEAGNNKDKDLSVATDHLIASRLFRSLKNRYDLSKNNLNAFKKDYLDMFEETFNSKPKFAQELLQIEIDKSNS